jgi:hypothetical protein
LFNLLCVCVTFTKNHTPFCFQIASDVRKEPDGDEGEREKRLEKVLLGPLLLMRECAREWDIRARRLCPLSTWLGWESSGHRYERSESYPERWWQSTGSTQPESAHRERRTRTPPRVALWFFCRPN